MESWPCVHTRERKVQNLEEEEEEGTKKEFRQLDSEGPSKLSWRLPVEAPLVLHPFQILKASRFWHC